MNSLRKNLLPVMAVGLRCVAKTFTCVILLTHFATAQFGSADDNPFGDTTSSNNPFQGKPFYTDSFHTDLIRSDSIQNSLQLPAKPKLAILFSFGQLEQTSPGGQIASVPCDPFMSAEQERAILNALRVHDATNWEATSISSLLELLPSTLPTYANRYEAEILGVDFYDVPNSA